GCGELIDQGHKRILRLAQRFGLATVNLLAGEPNGSDDTYYFFGQYYPKDQADADFQPVHNALQGDVQVASYPTTYRINSPGGIALDNMSAYDWIERKVPGGHTSPMGQLLDVAYNIEYGAETTDQSALNLVYLLGYSAKPGNFAIFGASNEKYHIVGGNQRLPETIAANLNEPVAAAWRMTAIGFSLDGRISVTFSLGAARMSWSLVQSTGGDAAGSFAHPSPYSSPGSNPQGTPRAETLLTQREPRYPGLGRRWNGLATLSVPTLDRNLNGPSAHWKV